MNRRIVAAVLALGLGLVGTVVLVSYVRGADARALTGVQTTSVLVVTQPVLRGTPAEHLADSVRLELVPVKVAATGSVSDLADLGDRVATVDLQPGEQIIAGRFADASTLLPPGTVEVPAGSQEISVLLEPQRAVGGRLSAGDEIGVYVSQTAPDGLPQTHAVLHGVLVTQVQGARVVADPSADEKIETASSGTAAPTDSPLMVTMAVPARQAELVVFGMEHGTVWLSLEPDGADNSGTQVIDRNNVYKVVVQ